VWSRAWVLLAIQVRQACQVHPPQAQRLLKQALHVGVASFAVGPRRPRTWHQPVVAHPLPRLARHAYDALAQVSTQRRCPAVHFPAV